MYIYILFNKDNPRKWILIVIQKVPPNNTHPGGTVLPNNKNVRIYYLAEPLTNERAPQIKVKLIGADATVKGFFPQVSPFIHFYVGEAHINSLLCADVRCVSRLLVSVSSARGNSHIIRLWAIQFMTESFYTYKMRMFLKNQGYKW